MNTKILTTKKFCKAEPIGGEVLRSSNLKHCTDVTYLKHCAKRKKFFQKTNSFIFAIIVAVSVIAIPCTTLAFTVYAASDDNTVAVVETQIGRAHV